jgi:uncharacterized protein YjbI with pentapeptide repeats
MVDAQRCRFRPKFDFSSIWFGGTEKYQCLYPVERNDRCIFHLPKSDFGVQTYDAATQKADAEKFQVRFEELVSEVTANHSFEKYDFRGFKFPFSSDLSKRIFEKEADFQEANFVGWVSFNKTVFRRKAAFREAVFEGSVSFEDCTFNQEADFAAAEFKENCSFSKTTFHQRATFSISEFSKDATFYCVTFHREADFDYCSFSARAQFTGDIGKPSFLSECDFRSLILLKESLLVFEKVNLGMARFLDTNLDEIVFRDIEWRFSGPKEQTYPCFTIESILDWPDFLESLKLSDSLEPPMKLFVNRTEEIEREHGSVGMSEFLRSTRNLDAPDTKRIIRDSLTDQSRNVVTNYERDQPLEETIKSSIVRDMNLLLERRDFYNRDSFHNVYYNDDAKALLEKGANRISKKNLFRLNRQLIEAVFPYDIAKRRRQLKGRKQNALWDEFRDLEDWESGREFGKIAENYSQLVINYERRRDFDTAEDFHVGEMEMRRKRKGLKVKRGWKRTMREWMNTYSVYRILNNYGTSYWRGLALLVGLILIVSWVFQFTGFQLAKEYSGNVGRVIEYDFTFDSSRWASLTQCLSDYWKSILFTLSIITFQRERFYEPAGDLSRFWLFIAVFVLTAQLAMVLLAIRRRFKR